MLTHPLAHHQPAEAQGGALRLAPLPAMTKLDLRARDAMVERFGDVLDTALPTVPLTSTHNHDVSVLWLGPDQWLVLGGDVQAKLEDALADGFGAVTDVSHQLVGLELRGPLGFDLLACGCRLDLHPKALPEGFASRTGLAKADIILHRRPDDGGPVLWLFVRRSFSDYLWHWLLTAGREFGLRR